MDGANEFRSFSDHDSNHCGAIMTVTTTIVIFSLKLFDIARVMTGGNGRT